MHYLYMKKVLFLAILVLFGSFAFAKATVIEKGPFDSYFDKSGNLIDIARARIYFEKYKVYAPFLKNNEIVSLELDKGEKTEFFSAVISNGRLASIGKRKAVNPSLVVRTDVQTVLSLKNSRNRLQAGLATLRSGKVRVVRKDKPKPVVETVVDSAKSVFSFLFGLR